MCIVYTVQSRSELRFSGMVWSRRIVKCIIIFSLHWPLISGYSQIICRCSFGTSKPRLVKMQVCKKKLKVNIVCQTLTVSLIILSSEVSWSTKGLAGTGREATRAGEKKSIWKHCLSFETSNPSQFFPVGSRRVSLLHTILLAHHFISYPRYAYCIVIWSNISDVGQNYYNCVLHRILTQWW